MKITSINELLLINESPEGFGKADLDLVGMAHKQTNLDIVIQLNSFTSAYDGALYISPTYKLTIPTAIIESVKEFNLDQDLDEDDKFTEEDLDNLYYIIADLYEHVLTNEGKKLSFKISRDSLLEPLKEKLDKEFGHREDFNKRINIILT